jgi:ATP-dependent helicase HepA
MAGGAAAALQSEASRCSTSERLAGAGAGDGNPFEGEQRVLCSLELLTDARHAAAVLGADWDLLIVDEAHHLHWTPEDSGLDYDLVEALAEQTPAVLLLTATPEQFGRAGHFGRLRLLDPQRFGDYDAFWPRRPGYAPVAEIAGPIAGSGQAAGATRSRNGSMRCSATRAELPTARSSRGCSTATAPVPHPVSQHPLRHRGLPGAHAHAYPLPRRTATCCADATDPLHPERDHEDGLDRRWTRACPGW